MGAPTAAGYAAASFYTALAATAVSAYAMHKQGQDRKRLAQYNAEMSRRSAADAVARGKVEELRHRRSVAQFMGRQRAAIGASGVVADQGSPLAIMEDTAALGELDALTIRENAIREGWGYQAKASAFSFEGSAAGFAGAVGATSTLVAGTSSAFSQRRLRSED